MKYQYSRVVVVVVEEVAVCYDTYAILALSNHVEQEENEATTSVLLYIIGA